MSLIGKPPPAPSRASPRTRLCLPCLESCAAFRPLLRAGWPDHGRCTHPRSRFCGYPVRIGRECPNFLAAREWELIPAK